MLSSFFLKRRSGRLCLLALLLGPLGLTSFVMPFQDAPAQSIFPGQPRHLPPGEDRRFIDPRREMRLLLQEAKANQHTNHFCLIAYAWPDGRVRAAVHWLEGKRLIPWEGRDPRSWQARQADSLLAAPYIDLTRDLVDTPQEKARESYYHLRAEAEGTLEDCQANGVRYTILPFDVGPNEAHSWSGR
ncbi:hypothetical protein [Pseudomonas sp. RIT-PI-AD]|uniref:hypothetical protein n=1 Tax=Pseudomonas sp. RIT-PI-AD TaxID=3035294 RepID=UPI0021D81583|nr:hypothetical protein [Pseudomonas sp. RIT-PI-AD]